MLTKGYSCELEREARLEEGGRGAIATIVTSNPLIDNGISPGSAFTWERDRYLSIEYSQAKSPRSADGLEV